MTWNTRPSHDAASLGRIGPAAADVSVSVELAGGATVVDAAGGLHSFAVVSPPTDGNGTHFASKEGSAANAAFLTIDWVGGDGGNADDGGGGDGSSGDGSGGGTAGIDGDGTTGGSGGASPLPGLGNRGNDDGGCACTSVPTEDRDGPRGLLAGLLAIAIVRRRRRRA